jgi:hypothetical protein
MVRVARVKIEKERGRGKIVIKWQGKRSIHSDQRTRNEDRSVQAERQEEIR